MAKLIELQEAAEMLGISPERLTDMRSRNEIFGYRDGSTWKFKPAEIERVKAEIGPSPPSAGSDDSGGDMDELVDVGDLSLEADDLELDDLSIEDDADVTELSSGGDDSDSILVSEEELGKSDENTASTIIGEPDALLPQDSAIDGSDALGDTSDLELSMEKSDVISTSDILDGGEEKPASASDTANLGIVSSSSIGDDLKLEDSGSLELSVEDSAIGGSRIEVSDDDPRASSSGFGSAIDLGLDDDELVLGSGTGSDVTAGAGDSGISLGNPSDSGLSLENPLELTGGSGVEALELGEEEVVDLGDSMGGAEADDDFMLTPVEDGLDEESDSGSQVIALDSEDFGDSAVEMLTTEDDELGGDAAEFIPDTEAVGAGGFEEAVAAPQAAGRASSADADDATYSIWNVLSLFSIVVLLGFTGILMLDLISNMWSWDGAFTFNSTIMDAILGMMP